MAPLEVIGAGMGRSGTDSLRIALDMLGYNTFHFKNFFYDMELNPDLFIEAHKNREEADWDEIYKNYTAAVDIPTWIWYKELMERYPDAKVILTARDIDSWYKSISQIRIHSQTMLRGIIPTQALRKRMILGDAVIKKSYNLKPETNDEEGYSKALYRQHYQEVMETVPKERLLVMELGEGWDRLCKFLGKEVPDVPYPRVNSSDEFVSFMNDVRDNPYFAKKITSD